MLERIVDFFHILRHLGLRISAGEAVQAINGLMVIDITDSLAVKAVFLAALAKSPQEQILVDKAFDAYFVSPEQAMERRERHITLKKQEAMELARAEEELSYVLEGPPGEGERRRSLPLNEEEKRTYINLPEEKKKRIMDYLNKNFQRNPVNNPVDLVTQVVSSSLNTWKYQLGMENQGMESFLRPLPTGHEELDMVIDQVVSQLKAEKNLLYQDIKNITEEDAPQAMAILRKMARHLAVRMSRRYKDSGKKEKPDMRRTVRHNIRYGGVLLELKYKIRKRSRPKLLILCDVSGSMSRYAAFVFHFIYGLAGILDKMDCFVFSETLEKLDFKEFLKNSNKGSLDKPVTDFINKSETWGRGTDLHHALIGMMTEHKACVSKETIVVLVSDTRTIGLDKAEEALEAFRSKVKDIIWLNPLPKEIWKNNRGAAVFKKHSKMFECSTLNQLNEVVSHQILI